MLLWIPIPLTRIAAADPSVQLFSGLTLGPGTYYLTLWSPIMAGGGWSFSTDPVTTVDGEPP